MREESLYRSVLCDLRYLRVRKSFNDKINPPELEPVLHFTIDPDQNGLEPVNFYIVMEDAAAFADELVAAANLIRAALKYDVERKSNPCSEF